MKKYINTISSAIIIMVICIILTSCKYEKIGEATFPDQTIYIPNAYNGIYTISSIVSSGVTKYSVDVTGKKFDVPLGVFRAGVTQDGDFSVEIKARPDTVLQLISSSILTDVEVLPVGKYTLPSILNVENGKNSASFSLSVDLDFLRANSTKKYAIGVGISSTQRKSNPKLSTVVVLIDASFIKPTADFTTTIQVATPKQVSFSNISKNAVSYSWDFGDGSPVSTTSAPTYTYTKAGVYNVTLKAIGITGELDASVKTILVTVL